jgi:hypothetical protein
MKDLGVSSAEFFFWKEGHRTDCEADYNGSSPAMEMTTSLRLWDRSESLVFYYTTLLSAGDAKAFSHL